MVLQSIKTDAHFKTRDPLSWPAQRRHWRCCCWPESPKLAVEVAVPLWIICLDSSDVPKIVTNPLTSVVKHESELESCDDNRTFLRQTSWRAETGVRFPKNEASFRRRVSFAVFIHSVWPDFLKEVIHKLIYTLEQPIGCHDLFLKAIF